MNGDASGDPPGIPGGGTTTDPGPILFLHPSDEAYGADRILLELIAAARDAGRRTAVLMPDDVGPGWLSEQLSLVGVPFAHVRLAPARRRYLRPGAIPRFVRDLFAARRTVRREAKRLDAAIIHVNTSALLVAAIIGRPGGCRLVWHVHEIISGRSPLRLLFRILPTLTADTVIAVSGPTADNLLRTRRSVRLITLPNGLPGDGPRPADLGDRRPIVAFVGRLNHWKGYQLFVSAAIRALPDAPSARFVVAGGAPAGDEWRVVDLEERIAAAGLGDGLCYLGERLDGAAIIAAADLVVVPSLLPDPLPTVVLEAMRAGRAVIAAAHGGALEMIQDGVTGLLVPPRDGAALAAAIGTLLADPDRREGLGRAARARFLERYLDARFRSDVQDAWRTA